MPLQVTKLSIVCILLIARASIAEAQVSWAYCDVNQRAYTMRRLFVPDCPPASTLPRRHVSSEAAALCPQKSVLRKVYIPAEDFICTLPTPETVEAAAAHRCRHAAMKHCSIAEGGEEGPGAHNVPGRAWFYQAGVSAELPALRCPCEAPAS